MLEMSASRLNFTRVPSRCVRGACDRGLILCGVLGLVVGSLNSGGGMFKCLMAASIPQYLDLS